MAEILDSFNHLLMSVTKELPLSRLVVTCIMVADKMPDSAHVSDRNHNRSGFIQSSRRMCESEQIHCSRRWRDRI